MDTRQPPTDDRQAGPAAPFTPSFPDQRDPLAEVRAALPDHPALVDVPMAGRVYPVTPPPPGNGRNGGQPESAR